MPYCQVGSNTGYSMGQQPMNKHLRLEDQHTSCSSMQIRALTRKTLKTPATESSWSTALTINILRVKQHPSSRAQRLDVDVFIHRVHNRGNFLLLSDMGWLSKRLVQVRDVKCGVVLTNVVTSPCTLHSAGPPDGRGILTWSPRDANPFCFPSPFNPSHTAPAYVYPRSRTETLLLLKRSLRRHISTRRIKPRDWAGGRRLSSFNAGIPPSASSPPRVLREGRINAVYDPELTRIFLIRDHSPEPPEKARLKARFKLILVRNADHNGATVKCAEPGSNRLLTFHQGDPGSIPCRVTPNLRTWESCRWSADFLGDIPFPPTLHSYAAPYSSQSPSSAPKTSMLRAAQISSLTAGMQGRGKQEIPDKTRPTEASRPARFPHGNPDSPWREKRCLAITSPRPPPGRGDMPPSSVPLAAVAPGMLRRADDREQEEGGVSASLSGPRVQPGLAGSCLIHPGEPLWWCEAGCLVSRGQGDVQGRVVKDFAGCNSPAAPALGEQQACPADVRRGARQTHTRSQRRAYTNHDIPSVANLRRTEVCKQRTACRPAQHTKQLSALFPIVLYRSETSTKRTAAFIGRTLSIAPALEIRLREPGVALCREAVAPGRQSPPTSPPLHNSSAILFALPTPSSSVFFVLRAVYEATSLREGMMRISHPLRLLSSVGSANGIKGNVVAEWLACSPPTKTNRAEYPGGSLPDFRTWESYRTMPLVDGFSRGSSVFLLSFNPAMLDTHLNPTHRLPRSRCYEPPKSIHSLTRGKKNYKSNISKCLQVWRAGRACFAGSQLARHAWQAVQPGRHPDSQAGSQPDS
ncbi:hypothetical protein PR048_000201 [Dryococelus australis]|uniref:Uncharacterized protein n=1 Tax=Dryococelus australis TaxID=614101 RepID=A0ABQ9IF62_9NEOP|nr:hypothetical protein PR048_000201 [Dryococelus australis]